MAIKGSDQISLVDLSDGYSLGMTSEGYTFAGDTQYALAGSCTTQIVCYKGEQPVPVKIGTCSCPTGVTAEVANNETTAPTITFTVAANKVSGSCEVSIPITVGDDITFTKKFSIGVALKGSTGRGISSSKTYYLLSDSATAPTFSASSFTDNANTATTSAKPYLWACTVITYTDGGTANTGVYLASKYVRNGTDVTVKSIQYAKGASPTTAPTSFTSTTPVATTTSEPYMWTKVTYSDNSVAYSVSAKGDTGAAGADAITISITTDNGTIFKNSEGETTLTAHVYVAGAELSDTDVEKLGTLKWYKDGATIAAGTGKTIDVSAASFTNKTVYTVKLEG